MRKLIVIVVVLASLYGGYWFVGRSQIQKVLTDALEQVDTGPADLTYTSLKTRGFPSRFDTTITDLQFSDPTISTIWTAPFFQLFALSYAPNEVIAVFPPEQTLSIGGTVYTLFNDDMRASGKVRPNAALTFQTATIEADHPRVRTEDGGELAMARLLAAMRLTPDTDKMYDVFLEARSIVLPQEFRRRFDPFDQQPPLIQNLRFDSDVALSAPIELNGSGTPAEIDALTLEEFAISWGDISVSAIGDVAADANGEANGSFSVTMRNWEQALDLAISSGTVNANRRFLFVEIAGNLDETPHIDDTLTMTITVTEGIMWLGGIRLGAAPLMR